MDQFIVDWNEKEQRWNWELVFCELYAGGKYANDAGENYEFSLGLNGFPFTLCVGGSVLRQFHQALQKQKTV